MPDSLFGHSCILELGDIKLTSTRNAPGPRIHFTVWRDKTEIPNNVEVDIWGLSAPVRNRLEEQENIPCRLFAGSGDNPGQLFSGTLAQAQTVKDGQNHVLHVSAGDAQDEYLTKKVAVAFASGTPVDKVLAELVSALGIGQGNLRQLKGLALRNGSTLLESGYVAHGSAAFELQLFANALSLDWSVQDGQFTAAPTGQPYADGGPLISSDTGLIELQKDHRGNVGGRVILQEGFLPGVACSIEHERFTGDVILSATEHEGDTREQVWEVRFSALPFGATSDGLMPEEKKKK